ncbi:MAG TPA: ABC transporter permease [Candidatus Aminicenantes bacterium]|nr:ABC transporter permease [Candidatus Aminicenantes bacterium]HRY64195.1 ABC transporter permease [Candidatus Aminicenantes bacterium]HRZ71108.1 ABC transporter permease [Candidatus Aminicenantes bacterium]
MIKRTLKHLGKTFKIAVRALGRNKMRSFLTALGIIIGVGAVIAMVSIGEGAKRGIEDRFASMGTNLLFVMPGSQNARGVHQSWGSMRTLKEGDALAIEKQCPAVMSISPSVNARAQTVYGNKNWNTSISGTGSMYPEVRNWEVETGSYFDEAMVKAGAKVCVLGYDVWQNLFENEDAIGKIIRVKKIPFKVLGVLKKRGESGGFGSRDDMITVPYTTAMRRLQGIDFIQSIDVRAVSSDKIHEAQTEIEELLRLRHRIAPGAEDDFTVRNMSDVAETAASATQMMTVLLGSIAGISLLVGGIGIMNIMLVSVTERIREIGLRMAVGAREKDILFQFLTEAIVLSLLGGSAGIAVGVGASKLLKNIKMFSSMKTVVSLDSVLLAFSFAAAIGIFFGFYPARKASRLDPIEALRYE